MMQILKWPVVILVEGVLWLLCGLNLYHFQVPSYNVIKEYMGERCAYCGKSEKECGS